MSLFLLALAADQATKVWARASLKPRFEPIVVINRYFELRYSENPGSAFGLFRGMPGARMILLAVGIGAMFVVISLLRRAKPEQRRIAGELGLLAGGALGNIIDRVARGVVTDFVVWKIPAYDWLTKVVTALGSEPRRFYEWPTFNIADAALVIGIAALFIDSKQLEPKRDSEDGGKRRVKKR